MLFNKLTGLSRAMDTCLFKGHLSTFSTRSKVRNFGILGCHICSFFIPISYGTLRERAVVGLGGFKSVPDAQRSIEIGYSVAPTYQGKGFATSVARQLIEIAFASKLVDCVCAHTLAEQNASTRVLEKCGMNKESETIDPDLGNLWRWEISSVSATVLRS